MSVTFDAAKVVSFFEKTKFSEKKALSSRPIMKKTAHFVATIGVFDGVHVGHRFLLNKVREVAAERGFPTLAVTFDPTPAEFFNSCASSSNKQQRLLTIDERRERLLEAGMDRVEVIPFNSEVAGMTALQFMKLLRERLGVRVLVMGYDHRFGCEQRSDAAFYDEVGIACGIEVLHASAYAGVSSTSVRESLLRGDVEEARALLGYPYVIEGRVVKGDGRGRTLGFPTANLAVSPEKLIPATGVYSVSVDLDGSTGQWAGSSSVSTLKGMMNIGLCPTFGGRTERRIEVHILDFDADIYGRMLKARLIHHLRNERKFPSVEALVGQLKADAAQIRALTNM